ncbi:MAG: PEFG-CTERM sorting domain-containing protein [Nitrososphaerota archaeon]|nr:PEFG-CTERM sorting domain-containing protein [Nitrososphaerota archaeon]
MALVLLIPISSVYGHGLGLETIKLNADDKKLSITTQISPTEFSEAAQKQITMTITDSLTTQNVDAILLIALYHEDTQVFREYFGTTNGVLRIDVNPNIEGQIQISGQQEQTFDAWYETESNPLEITGPILNTGGLYRFEVEIKSIDSETMQNQGFSTYITSITNHGYDKQDKNGNPVRFDVKSYYDKISSFDYSPDTNSITLEMPFDWSEQNISHTEVVHEEVHFPKDFVDLLVPSYTGTVNGIDLFKSSITIDDYSIEDQRIVHFVLSQDTLRYLKQAQKDKGVENPQDMKFVLKVGSKVVFPVIAMTKDESLQVDLSWEPEVIEPDKNTKFIFTFRDGKTGELLRNTTYDFVILQSGKQIHAKSANAQIGGDYVDYTFSESQKGPITIQFNNLRGTSQGTEFSIMVVPEFGVLVFVILAISITSVIVFSRKRLVFL